PAAGLASPLFTASYLYVYIHIMEFSALLREARLTAGITQLELAHTAGTAQPAVAAYESGARTPSLPTLRRLLDACDHDLEVTPRPRVRRGAASLAELAQTIGQDLRKGGHNEALRLLFAFADDFRGSSRPGRIALMADDPPLTGDLGFDSALAGIAELFASEAAIPAPSWVNGPGRFAEPWWFLASRPAFHAYTLAHTPALLARHGVFMAREVFDRA